MSRAAKWVHLSRRTAMSRVPNALAQMLTRRRAEGRRVLDLTVSNPTSVELPLAADAIADAIGTRNTLVYRPEPFGDEVARAAVARHLTAGGATVPIENIALTASTSEAYGFVFKLLCDPGDEVLIPQPSYPLFDTLAALDAVRLVPYRLAYDGAWHVDLDSVRQAIGPRTRAILAVHPNNPTGNFLTRDETAALAGMGLPLVSDEVFSAYDLRVDPPQIESVLVADAPLVFTLGGLSKLAALPQMKVGWLAMSGTPTLVDEARARLELICDAYLSVSAPVMLGLPALIDAGAMARAAIRKRTRRNLDALDARLGLASAITRLRVDGGWYAIIRLPRIRSEEAWCLELLEGDGVYIHPGHFFDFTDEAYAVLSLLTPPAIFDEGIDAIATRVDGV